MNTFNLITAIASLAWASAGLLDAFAADSTRLQKDAEQLAYRSSLLPPSKRSALFEEAQGQLSALKALANEPFGRDIPWGRAVTTAFRVLCLADSRSFGSAKADLELWLATLENLKWSDSSDLCLQISSDFLSRWVTYDPKGCFEVYQASKDRYLATAGQQSRASWIWREQIWFQILKTIGRSRPDKAWPTAIADLDAELSQCWKRSDIPLEIRTASVAESARQAYSEGHFTEAAAIMDGWIREHPDLTSIEFFEVRFLVAWFGEGNEEKAQQQMRTAEALVAGGTILSDNPHYALMVRLYYQYLTSSRSERTKKTRIKQP